MRNISIKWRMTLWFSLLMIAITALMLVFSTCCFMKVVSG